jgi:hypothetical protein
MRTKETAMRVREWIIVLAIGLSGGCEWDMHGFGPQQKPAPATAPAPAPATRPVVKTPDDTPKPLESYLAKNGPAKEGEPANQTAVESALSWANKYSQSMQTVTELQRESRDQQKEMQALGQQNVKLQDELAAAQKELKDANTLLIEMRQELTKWKTDVLGFRSEMKEAQQAQLGMLSRVLKVLGSDATPAPTPAPAPAAVPAPAAPAVPTPVSALQPATEPASAPARK